MQQSPALHSSQVSAVTTGCRLSTELETRCLVGERKAVGLAIMSIISMQEGGCMFDHTHALGKHKGQSVLTSLTCRYLSKTLCIGYLQRVNMGWLIVHGILQIL